MFKYKCIDGREAILLMKIKDGLPFIPEQDIVLQIDMWEIIFLDTMTTEIVEIQHEYKNSYIASKYSRNRPKETVIIDRFIKFNGIEAF